MEAKMTLKQRFFVEEMLVDLNATQAAIRAGYSPRTAQRIGSENLSEPLIQAALTEARRKRSERNRIDADEVLRELRRAAMSDDRDVAQ